MVSARESTDGFAPFEPRRRRPPDDAGAGGAAARSIDEEPAAAPLGSATTPDETAPLEPIGESDVEAFEARVRELAIRIAGIACARALHAAVARNPLFVTRFVDDALAAAGSPAACRVRLHPADACASPPRDDCDIVADPCVQRGSVAIEVDGASLGADVDQRAYELARAAADA